MRRSFWNVVNIVLALVASLSSLFLFFGGYAATPVERDAMRIAVFFYGLGSALHTYLEGRR